MGLEYQALPISNFWAIIKRDFDLKSCSKGSKLRRYRAKLYIKIFKVPFFRGPSSAVNFECRLLSVEPDHDYEIEKLC